jgi:hypothetical protein
MLLFEFVSRPHLLVLFAIALRTTIICDAPVGSEGDVNEDHFAKGVKPDFTMMLGISSFVNGEALVL